jgi:hypothetical protein
MDIKLFDEIVPMAEGERGGVVVVVLKTLTADLKHLDHEKIEAIWLTASSNQIKLGDNRFIL